MDVVIGGIITIVIEGVVVGGIITTTNPKFILPLNYQYSNSFWGVPIGMCIGKSVLPYLLLIPPIVTLYLQAIPHS